MPKLNEGSADATAYASGFIAIHLFKLLIEKGVLDREDGMAILKMVRNDLALAARDRLLDPIVCEAERAVSKMYASLQNEAAEPAASANSRAERKDAA